MFKTNSISLICIGLVVIPKKGLTLQWLNYIFIMFDLNPLQKGTFNSFYSFAALANCISAEGVLTNFRTTSNLGWFLSPIKSKITLSLVVTTQPALRNLSMAKSRSWLRREIKQSATRNTLIFFSNRSIAVCSTHIWDYNE